ncbi:MAG: Appr-1-p processing protein, partial [Oscillatoriales cyanobacterium]
VAIADILLSQYQFPKSWLDAQKSHRLLYAGDAGDLQLENSKD